MRAGRQIGAPVWGDGRGPDPAVDGTPVPGTDPGAGYVSRRMLRMASCAAWVRVRCGISWALALILAARAALTARSCSADPWASATMRWWICQAVAVASCACL